MPRSKKRGSYGSFEDGDDELDSETDIVIESTLEIEKSDHRKLTLIGTVQNINILSYRSINNF